MTGVDLGFKFNHDENEVIEYFESCALGKGNILTLINLTQIVES